jgi:hypothetical protein
VLRAIFLAPIVANPARAGAVESGTKAVCEGWKKLLQNSNLILEKLKTGCSKKYKATLKITIMLKIVILQHGSE